MDNHIPDSVKGKVVGRGKEDTLQEFAFPPFLQKNGIHVWSVGYGDLDRHFRILSSTLRPEERYIASTFRNSNDARKYILRHGLLRIILGNYTNQDPAMISLFSGKNGKPELYPHDGYADLSFNMSHTSEMILIGVTRKHRIGVDIVKMDPSYQFQDSAEYIFTPAEKAFMQRTEPAMRYQIFFRIWALKEAILKVNGGTLTLMKNMDVSEIIQDVFSSPCFSDKYLNRHPPFFIWQFNSGSGHHGVIASELMNPI